MRSIHEATRRPAACPLQTPAEIPFRFDSIGFREALLGWWAQNAREYPWRQTRDPYAVFVAEVLLHRTRASQVRPVYERIMECYPHIDDLADAPLEELHRSLNSLGLAWRVDLLLAAARTIVERHGGYIPREIPALLRLPGVGPYIAAAVRCFAYGEPDAILDTNTVRICGRVFDLPVNDLSRRSPRFRAVLQYLLDSSRPREFNFALLDHAALVCTSRLPRCAECVVLKHCSYGSRRSAGVPPTTE